MKKKIEIPTHDETLQKIIKAMETVEKPKDRAEVSLSYSELRYIKRLILSELATTELMFESLNEHIAFTKKQKESDTNANDS